VNPDSWDRESAINRIKERFGIEGNLIEAFEHPYLYFTEAVKNDSSIDQGALELAVVEELMKLQGVSLAVSSTALRSGDLPDTELMDSVKRNFHVKRSGDVFIVFEPNWFINDFDGLVVASTHGSPWSYDTYVPIVFAGAGIKPQIVDRRVHTVDIAPTLSAVLSIRPPSGAAGDVLHEVSRQE
jgi:hypothetical protein